MREVAIAAGVDERRPPDPPQSAVIGHDGLCHSTPLAVRVDEVAVQGYRDGGGGGELIERQLGVLGVDHHDRVPRPPERDLLVGAGGSQASQELFADAADDPFAALIEEAAVAQHRACGRRAAEKRVPLDQAHRRAGPRCTDAHDDDVIVFGRSFGLHWPRDAAHLGEPASLEREAISEGHTRTGGATPPDGGDSCARATADAALPRAPATPAVPGGSRAGPPG